MSPHRADSFLQALAGIRERLREGEFRPGDRIAATELAARLGLSATPVREALFRISGEGLLEDRRGQGFFVSALTGLDIADLYRLSLAHLTMALQSQRLSVKDSPPPSQERSPGSAIDAVRDVETLFADWITESRGQSLWVSYRSLDIKLGPVRRVEPLLLGNLAEEAAALRLAVRSSAAERLAALRTYHARRIDLADQLAPLLNRYRGGRGV